MGMPSPLDQVHQGTAQPTRFRFVVRLVIPVSCLVLVWAAVAGAVLSGALNGVHWIGSGSPGHRAAVQSALVAAAGLVVVLATITLAALFARRVTHHVAALAGLARGLADEQLRTASAAAAADASARDGLRQLLGSLGSRNQSLLHRQLRIIDSLENKADSPAVLAELFALDHLTTRMRRHAESLTILSGAEPARSWSRAVPVVDVIRAAASEVEDYKRVTVVTDAEEAVAMPAVTDMIHLLAELIENATLFSPSSTRVEVKAEHVANGFAIEIEDRGLGIAPDQLSELNEQLANPPGFDLVDADRLGLFVTARLAARHGVAVSLSPSAYRGTKAVVLLPDSIVTKTAPEPRPVPAAIDASAGLNPLSPAALSLADAVHARSLLAVGSAAGTATETDHDAPADSTAAATFHGLPRRIRPASSAPSNPDGTGPSGPATTHAPPETPAPEQTRDLFSSLQDGWERSLRDDTPETDSAVEDEEA